MPYFDFIWELTENGNVAHIAENGLTPDDVEPIVLNPDRVGVSRSSGRPIAFGETKDGRVIPSCTIRLTNSLCIRLPPSR